jgi:hypothetical protein
MFDNENELSEKEGQLESRGMDGNTMGGRTSPHCSIRKTGAQQQDTGVLLKNRGGNGQETS